jgi:uncharacterized protein YecE (DUF72 family)
MTVSTYIGTSGWHYDHWEGPFYPTGLPDNSFLEYYASCFYRGRYGVKRLVGWANVFSAWRKEGLDVYCYFDNDEAGYAVQDALSSQQMMTEG